MLEAFSVATITVLAVISPETPLACAFSSAAARRFVASSRHLVERAIGGVLVALGLGLAVSSLNRS